MFKDKTSLEEAPPEEVTEEPGTFLAYDDIEKKTDTTESTGRSAIFPDLLYRGREGRPMKSSRSKRNGFLEAS
jgi:hypothetical protein